MEVEFLLTAGVDMNAKSNTGWTPLHMAARDGYSESVSALVAAGSDVNAVNNNGETLQDVAIQYGDLTRGGEDVVEIIDALTPTEVSPMETGEPTGEPMAGTSALTIERVGERTEVRWKDGGEVFSGGKWVVAGCDFGSRLFPPETARLGSDQWHGIFSESYRQRIVVWNFINSLARSSGW